MNIYELIFFVEERLNDTRMAFLRLLYKHVSPGSDFIDDANTLGTLECTALITKGLQLARHVSLAPSALMSKQNPEGVLE